MVVCINLYFNFSDTEITFLWSSLFFSFAKIIFIYLLGAPEIEIPQEYFSEVKHKAGSNVELMFNITAKPAPTIEWFKDGRELKPTAQLSFKHTFESTSLFLKETTRLNSGTYEVKVKNSLGSACAIVRLLIQGYYIFIYCLK